MHLPEEDRNISIPRILFAFSMDKIDNRTDGLPMMGSIAWPIGSFNFKMWYFQGSNLLFISGIGGLDMFLVLVGYHVKGGELLCLISKHNNVGKCILLLFNFTQSALECILIYLLSIGLLGITS